MIKLFGTNYSLSCIVDQNIQFIHMSLNIVDQSFNLHLRNEVTLNDLQTILPLVKIILGLVTSCGVIWKSRGNYHGGSVSQ